jgi:hypothetical protein
MEFRQLTNKDIEETLIKWEQEAIQYDCFPDEVHQKFVPIQESIRNQPAGSYKSIYYGVFQEGQNIAVALCDLVLSDKGMFGGKWLKLMKLTLSPEVDTLQIKKQPEAISLVANAYKTAVLGAFAARNEHEADTLKLYGRSEEQLTFLILLLTIINQDHSHELSAQKEGRWLVLRSSAPNEGVSK